MRSAVEFAKTVLILRTNDSYLGPCQACCSRRRPMPPSPRPLMSRPTFVFPLSFGVAGAAALLAERLSPPRYADLVAVCVAWIAFYPIPRLKPTIPWWLHWVQGVFIVFGFWLVTHGSN